MKKLALAGVILGLLPALALADRRYEGRSRGNYHGGYRHHDSGSRFSFGLSFGTGGYYRPAYCPPPVVYAPPPPVVYVPPPVVYAPPPPVVYAPAPVYVAPPPVYYAPRVYYTPRTYYYEPRGSSFSFRYTYRD